MASLTITPSRQKVVDFTSPEYCSGLVFTTKGNAANDLKSLKNKEISVLAGSTAEDFLKENGFTNIKRYPSVSVARSHVAFGQSVALLDDTLSSKVWVNSPIAKTTKMKLSAPVVKDVVGIAVPKESQDMKKAINGALAKIIADGTYAKLSQKWLKSDLRCK